MSTIEINPSVAPQLPNYSKSELRGLVAGAELPPLLATLAFLLGDERFVSEQVRPPLTPAQAEIFPQGGMSPEQQEQARTLAVEGVARYLSGERAAVSVPPQRILDFLTGGEAQEYEDLLLHELGEPKHGTPTVPRGIDLSRYRVAVIGAGMSGLAMAYNLKRAGVDHVVFEKNAGCGGTWLENRYPGCRLDTNNFAYSFSFAQRADWPDQFSKRDDIWQYFDVVADEYEIRDKIRFNTYVSSAVFDEDQAKWLVTSAGSDGLPLTEVFDFVVMAVGQLNTPKLPDIPGIEDFAGEWCHSATWPEHLDITGKRVAVVGTGASAYQIVPSIVDQVQGLYVVQRTAPWMMPTPTYQQPLPEGMLTLLQLLPEYAKWLRFWQFWLAAEGRMSLVTVDAEWDRASNASTISMSNLQFREQLLERFRSQFADHPELLERVIPTYPPGGKRLLRDDGSWARALTSPHTELVTDGVEHITPGGLMLVGGREIEVDVIVYATGFAASDFLSTIDVRGTGGTSIREFWDGEARAYKGVSVPGFPGLGMLYGPNTNLVVTGSAVFMSECAAEYIVRLIIEMELRGGRQIDVTDEAYREYAREMDRENRLRAWGVDGFDNWYKNKRGTVTQNWPLSLHRFFEDSRSVETQDYVSVSPSKREGSE
ncbi:monooxygenase [Leucobacter sp. UCD-THU]|uniref:NAD(P)/FAD-dependent oxidoreductase n=1 Tax=Leucobacter muris TaxID=1935379 RepID=A0ABX5QI40_9MICO|nr:MULTISPECIES: NAD(P)/FAD-dependent oxidoreductase [Leucobacter]EYT55224.1 monooxygenase [Leucobacter sp. UCD-THU]QAB18686.1 NAD(P)/FAD-dependent oxidoreductase [Leucobacter muris]